MLMERSQPRLSRQPPRGETALLPALTEPSFCLQQAPLSTASGAPGGAGSEGGGFALTLGPSSTFALRTEKPTLLSFLNLDFNVSCV